MQKVQYEKDEACCAAKFTISWKSSWLVNLSPSTYFSLLWCHPSQTVPISVKAIYPAFLMGLGDRLKQKFLHVLPSLTPKCTQTQRCMAWFMWVKIGRSGKLLEVSLLSFAPCRPFHALLNVFLFQPFYKGMQQWNTASSSWWVDTLRTKDFVSHKSHPSMNSE